jgi:NADH-quinone oxidoreductase subunit I
MSYFGSLWNSITTTCQGLKITTGYLLDAPRREMNERFTMQYPDERPVIDKVTHRGLHEFDVDRCINCSLCAKACPVDCIYIESIEKGKPAVMTRYEIDYSKCLFCGLCVPPCPSECIQLGERYSLPGHTRDEMIVKFHLGGYPILELTPLAQEQVKEYEDEGLFAMKTKKREELGLPVVPGGQNRARSGVKATG